MGHIHEEGQVEDVAVRDTLAAGRRREVKGERDHTTLDSLTPALRERMKRLAEWQERFVTARGLGERLRLLVAFGLTDHDIAKVVPDARPRSVRRWRTEGPPRTRAAQRWEPIDDLCVTVGYFLANATYDEEGIVEWLRSRNAALDQQRPLDVLGEGGFDAVRDAAEHEIELIEVPREDLLPVPRSARPPARTQKGTAGRGDGEGE